MRPCLVGTCPGHKVEYRLLAYPSGGSYSISQLLKGEEQADMDQSSKSPQVSSWRVSELGKMEFKLLLVILLPRRQPAWK
jgi:hypothetical protein